MKKSNAHVLHIFYWLILSVPVALCAVLFIFCRDVEDICLMIAGSYAIAAMGSVGTVLSLQQEEPKIRQHLIPFLFVIPLALLAFATTDSMAAWFFLLLMSICVGMLLRSAAVTLTDFIHKKRRMKAVKQPAAARPADPPDQTAPLSHGEPSRITFPMKDENQPAAARPANPPDQTAPRSHGEPSHITFPAKDVKQPAAAQPADPPDQTAPHSHEESSHITFPVKDVIKERLARRQYRDLWYCLHSARSDRDLTCYTWAINRLTGELRLVTSVQRDYSEDPQIFFESCTEMDIRRYGSEALKDFTAENWRDYVPDKPPEPISQKPAMVVPAEACRPGKKADVDAYFMVHSHQIDAYYYESLIIYLRRCDTGWRLFYDYCCDARISLFRKAVEDEHRLQQLTEKPYVFDRLLTAAETAYVMNLLPDRHDGVQGIRADWCFVHGQKGPLEACYWKDGYCVDCAQLPHIPELLEKLAALAERGLAVEGGNSGQEA